MCGRFTLTAALNTIQSRFAFDDETIAAIEPFYRPNRNIAPTQPVLTIVSGEERIQPMFMRWGLIPSWSKTDKTEYTLFNARAESLATKPMFRSLIARNRCLIVADGFYEFRAEGKKKIPVHFFLNGHFLFSFAGLYDQWKDPVTGKNLFSCTMITTEPNELIKPVHNRMPVILPEDKELFWLKKDIQTADLFQLLKPFKAESMESQIVDPSVTSMRGMSSGSDHHR